VSIVVVFIGGALWGAAGMFMAIPLIAIVKVLCDKIPMLSAFSVLIGDEMPKEKPFQHTREQEQDPVKGAGA
jgi:predicted PurR-regulated permease PerM